MAAYKLKYIPPLNFGMVEAKLYRSGIPNELNFPFLERLKLKTMIYLEMETDPTIVNFCHDQDIEFVHLGAETMRRTWRVISEETVLAALNVILEPDKYPILIVCNLGRHRSGTVVGCLRKVLRWNLTSTLQEFRRYCGAKVRLANEQFIELFDTDLVRIPTNPPTYFPS